ADARRRARRRPPSVVPDGLRRMKAPKVQFEHPTQIAASTFLRAVAANDVALVWQRLSRETRGLLEGLYAARNTVALHHAAGAASVAPPRSPPTRGCLIHWGRAGGWAAEPPKCDERDLHLCPRTVLRGALSLLRFRHRARDLAAPRQIPRGASGRDRARGRAARPAACPHALRRGRHAEPARTRGDRIARRRVASRLRAPATGSDRQGEPRP